MTDLGVLWPDEAIEAMHLAALALLERAGVRVESCRGSGPAARGWLHGGRRPASSSRARWWTTRSPPARGSTCWPRATPSARSPWTPAPAQTYVHNMGGARDVSDPRTGAGRRATLRDQLLATRVMHHLTHQQQVTSLWQPEDVPDLLEPLYSYLVLAWETDKAIGGPGISHPFQALYLQEMAVAVTGADGSDGTYPVDLAFSPVSPLILGGDVSDALVEQVRRGGVAVEILPCPAAATTAPGSLSAAIAQQHAEVLAGVVLTQVGRPRHARLLRPASERRGPAQRRRRQRHSGDGRRLRRGRAARAPLRPRLRLLRPVQRQQGRGHAVRLRTRRQRPARARGAPTAPLRHRGDPGGVASCLEVLVIDDEVLNNVRYALSPRPWDPDALDVDAMVDGVLSGRGFLARSTPGATSAPSS